MRVLIKVGEVDWKEVGPPGFPPDFNVVKILFLRASCKAAPANLPARRLGSPFGGRSSTRLAHEHLCCQFFRLPKPLPLLKGGDEQTFWTTGIQIFLRKIINMSAVNRTARPQKACN